MERPKEFNPENIMIDPDSIYLDPIEAQFVEQRGEIARHLHQYAQDIRKNSYGGSKSDYEIAELLERDRTSLLSLLLFHEEAGPTGWVDR
ncbi:hypothetical protein N7528_000763 [Penicillium herquei]|nr:hypothetical protein N7528_000763 [Penicillium herquei]